MNVAYTDIQENDKVLIQPITGAVITGYTVVVTPGVGFAYTASRETWATATGG